MPSELLITTGTAATVLAVLLLLLRVSIDGRRRLLRFAHRWAAARAPASAAVLGLLAAIAASAFSAAPPIVVTAAREHTSEASGADLIGNDADLLALRDFARAIDGEPQPAHAEGEASPMPGVDEMIAKLVTRLEQHPGDARGWKMLGWSYLNTGRHDLAVRAYQTALRLAPGDREIAAGLTAAKDAATSNASSTQTAPRTPTP